MVDEFLREHFFKRRKALPTAALRLTESAEYSVFSGGKRFRPQICFLTADALSASRERVLPFAAAVELIHTYSLIHDDLPVMDDDDFRRGLPTNHRMYGEGLALLTGDALLTEAFYVLGEHYVDIPEAGLELVKLLSEAAGLTGMVAGQVLDVELIQAATQSSAQPKAKISLENILTIHQLKTAALIRVAVEGAAVTCRATPAQRAALREAGAQVGLAFQLKDDLLDHDPKNAEASGLLRVAGVSETERHLAKATQEALNQLEIFGSRAHGLRELVEYNLSRKN